MTHTKGTQAAVSQNNKCTKLVKENKLRVHRSFRLKFPSSAWLSNCMRVLYIYAPPSLPLSLSLSFSLSLQFVFFLVQWAIFSPPQHRRCPPAGPSHDGLKQSIEEQSCSLMQAVSSKKHSSKNNQVSQPKGPAERGWTRTGALPWTHTCKPHTHTYTHTN